MGGLRTPVRSEIGPYQTLAEGATMPQAPEAFFGCGYAALGAMQARSSVSVYDRKASLQPDDLANAARIREIVSEGGGEAALQDSQSDSQNQCGDRNSQERRHEEMGKHRSPV